MNGEEIVVKVKEVAWKISSHTDSDGHTTTTTQWGIKYETPDGQYFFTDSYPYSKKEALEIKKIGSMRIICAQNGTKTLKFKRAIEDMTPNENPQPSVIEIDKNMKRSFNESLAWQEAFETIGTLELDPELLPLMTQEILEGKSNAKKAWKNISRGQKAYSVSFLILVLILMFAVPIYAFIVDKPILFIVDVAVLLTASFLYVSLMIWHANLMARKIENSPLMNECMATVIGCAEVIGAGYFFGKTIQSRYKVVVQIDNAKSTSFTKTYYRSGSRVRVKQSHDRPKYCVILEGSKNK